MGVNDGCPGTTGKSGKPWPEVGTSGWAGGQQPAPMRHFVTVTVAGTRATVKLRARLRTQRHAHRCLSQYDCYEMARSRGEYMHRRREAAVSAGGLYLAELAQ